MCIKITQNFLRDFNCFKRNLFCCWIRICHHIVSHLTPEFRTHGVLGDRTFPFETPKPAVFYVVHCFSKKKPPTLELITLHLSRLQNNKLWAEKSFLGDESVNLFEIPIMAKKSKRKKWTPYIPNSSTWNRCVALFVFFGSIPNHLEGNLELHSTPSGGATSFAALGAKSPRDCKRKCRNGTVVLEILEVNSQRSCGCNECDSMSTRKGHRWSWWKKRSSTFRWGVQKNNNTKTHHTQTVWKISKWNGISSIWIASFWKETNLGWKMSVCFLGRPPDRCYVSFGECIWYI